MLPEAPRSKPVGRTLLVASALVVLGFAWAPGASAPYQYDDYVTPVKDPASQSLGAFARSLPRTLRPLTKLTYAAESSAEATSAPARRVVNAGLFLACVALLALLARASGLDSLSAAGIATVWAAHPVHAETVIALAGRSVLLSLGLILASAVLLARRRVRLALCVAVLAVLARETAWAWLVGCASFAAWERGVSRRLVGTVALASFTLGGVLTLVSARLRELMLFSWTDPDAWNRLGLQWAALPRGVLLLFVAPGDFSVDMEFLPRGLLRFGYILAALALYGTAGWLLFRRRSTAPLRLAALLWLCLVLPLHSVVPKLDPLTARSFSGSSAALAALFAAALAARQLPKRPALFVAGAVVCLATLVPLTRAQAARYRDPVALWRDAVQKSTTKTRPLINLGTLLAQTGDLVEARRTLEEAVRRNPQSRESRERLAAVNVLIETKKLLTAPHSP